VSGRTGTRHRAYTVVASLPRFCDVCSGAGQVRLRAADDPDARWDVFPCPHCGPMNLPQLLLRRRIA